MKKYDGLYIFAGNAKDDVLENSLAKAVAEIERFGGKIEAQDILGKRTFARPMHKRENGVYALVRFEMDPLKVKDLVNRYRIVEEVFRVQILAVDDRREEKLAQQREAAAKRAELKARKENEAAAASAE
ncbi:MAG: 30S ribosomal protein S6 [Verrucomicrobiota bacterium]|nr:30S ribosomal protein S6 [Verrucomicrobiota bacterium]MDY5597460.1 30S ribosomal protein S6 [Kiritimatiellia bacterium]